MWPSRNAHAPTESREACPYAGDVGEMFLANLAALRPTERTRQAVAKACTCGQHRLDPPDQRQENR